MWYSKCSWTLVVLVALFALVSGKNTSTINYINRVRVVYLNLNLNFKTSKPLGQ